MIKLPKNPEAFTVRAALDETGCKSDAELMREAAEHVLGMDAAKAAAQAAKDAALHVPAPMYPRGMFDAPPILESLRREVVKLQALVEAKSTPPAELAQPAARAIPEPAPAATATQKRGRNDAIKPLISKAQQEAANPEDASEVFNILKEWALRPKPPAPLMSGLSKDGKGVLWEDANGNTEALSRDALAQRLRRMRTAPASSARLRVSKLQRVK